MSRELSYQKYDATWGVNPVPPIPETPLYGFLKEQAQKKPNKDAVIFFHKKTTYNELDDLSDRVAHFLVENGVRKGDRVATMLPNCTQHVIVFYGILKAGAVIVPFNVMLKADEIRYILQESGSKVLFCVDLLFPVVKPVADELKITPVVTVHVKDFSEPTAQIPPILAGDKNVPDGAADFMHVISGDTAPFSPVAIDPKRDLVMFLYTSGTTGFPKGAMISHYNFCAACANSEIIGITGQDVFIMLFPLFHVAGYSLGLLVSVYKGLTAVLVPRFDPVDMMDLIQRFKVTIMFSPPTAYIGLLNAPDFKKYDLSSIRTTVACGAPVPPPLQKEWEEKVGTYLYNGYGCTETCASAPGIIEMEHKRKFAGETLGATTCELKIVNEEKDIVPRGEVGEFVHKGPGIALGYWKKPKETAEQFTDDGWWYSGDMGYMDDDGFVYFTERKKDLIIASGYNIAPAEVENYLYGHPAVKEAGVVGVPDEYRGETVKAFVVLKDEYKGKVTEKDIIAFGKEKMAAYKAPKVVEFIDEIPKTMTGKVLRRVLRDR
ncbi:MAG: AMP-binding protein [Deltaproteobacteria bacterium]|nr:AMP-binding protein [Candidatus Zymogenaceae bacterium]